ncbi:DUF1488 domain-containing protein [Shewanella sp. YIC-542]|uniref:DUF1488 domain-containing protein n=1 Tax=Shewanella mytili TaxID=3377111 RepID=UPI00398F4942
MNQSVIFGEQGSWLAPLDAVEFIAQQQGYSIKCRVGRHYLQQHCAAPLETETEILHAFEAQRFELEELVETLIMQEAFDEAGHIVLG